MIVILKHITNLFERSGVRVLNASDHTGFGFTFIDLFISNGCFLSQIYDKLDDFSFVIVNFSFLKWE